MQETINPATERPYTDAIVFLLQCFFRVESTNELFKAIDIITKDKPFSLINIFLTMQAHYLLEQARRQGGVDFEPLPTANNILNGNKCSMKFKAKKDYKYEYEDFHYHCFKEDYKK